MPEPRGAIHTPGILRVSVVENQPKNDEQGNAAVALDPRRWMVRTMALKFAARDSR
jgi:hypothetical protein